jgi:hypothetical protein
MKTAPSPVSKAFLVCDKIVTENGRTSLLNLADAVVSRFFPAAHLLGIYSRWGSAHGDYEVEVQLQTPDEKVVWRGGPPEKRSMPDALRYYDMNLNLNVVFPEPGTYDLVLLANGEEIARQKINARVKSKPAEQ